LRFSHEPTKIMRSKTRGKIIICQYIYVIKGQWNHVDSNVDYQIDR
jgi:hypothetical protein